MVEFKFFRCNKLIAIVTKIHEMTKDFSLKAVYLFTRCLIFYLIIYLISIGDARVINITMKLSLKSHFTSRYAKLHLHILLTDVFS